MFEMNFILSIILNCFIAHASSKLQAKKFVYVEKFEGLPKITDFKLEEETLPELKDGGKWCLNIRIKFQIFH